MRVTVTHLSFLHGHVVQVCLSLCSALDHALLTLLRADALSHILDQEGVCRDLTASEETVPFQTSLRGMEHRRNVCVRVRETEWQRNTEGDSGLG